MSEISAGLKNTIKDIKQLADGSMDDQLKSCKLLRKKMFPFDKPKTGVNESVIREILPTIIKFMESNDLVIQQEGANSITCMINTPDKTNTQLVIDAGVIPRLVNILSSTNTDVLISTLKAFVNIAIDFPEKVIENEILQSIIQYLKSENKEVSRLAAQIVFQISYASEERITAIFDAGGVEPLIEILKSKDDDVIKYVLWSLFNIISCNNQYCQLFLDVGGLKSLKKLCDRLFGVKKPRRRNFKADKNKLKQEKVVKLSAIRLISYVGEAQIDLIIKENFIPLILQQIKSGTTLDIKLESVEFIEYVISYKPDFIPSLVQDYNIFSFCYSNLGSTIAYLLFITLTTMCNIAELFEDQDITRQKIRVCDGPMKLTNLFKHSNEEIRRLSTMLYEFVFDVKPDPIVGVSGESNQQEPKLIELDDSEDDDIYPTPQTRRQRKRQANTQPARSLRRSKRFRVSLEQTDTDNTDSSSDDDVGNGENDQYNDFDDHPRSFSPINSAAGAVPTESNRHDHSGRQSFVDDDTLAANRPSRLHPKEEPTPQSYDMPATSASRQSPDLPVASASTNNENTLYEMKPSPAGRFGNQSRLLSNNAHSVPEAASTRNDGNIGNNPAGSPIVVNCEIAATADGIIRNGVNPGKQSPADDDLDNSLSRPSSAISPALPIDSASNGTMPNDIPSRKALPDTKPVITFELPNQVTPPTAAANNDVRDDIVKYWRPAEFLIHQYCDTLEIQFSRKEYDAFTPKIEFTQITSNSKPDAVFQPIDQTGFGCLSILLTGNEDASSVIRMKINKKFIDDLMQSGNFDEETIIKVISPPFLMKEEHFQTIAVLFKCRILVYCNGWKKYGSWETEDQMIPIFVLEKKEMEGKTEYSIVWTLKND